MSNLKVIHSNGMYTCIICHNLTETACKFNYPIFKNKRICYENITCPDFISTPGVLEAYKMMEDEIAEMKRRDSE